MTSLRKSVVEHPFATIKYRIFGHPRLLMRGLSGARVEIGIATMAYNIKRMTRCLARPDLQKLSTQHEPRAIISSKRSRLNTPRGCVRGALHIRHRSFVMTSELDPPPALRAYRRFVVKKHLSSFKE